MKPTYLLLISLLFLLMACGGEESVKQTAEELIEEGDLQKLRTLKSELTLQQQELTEKIARLDKKISELAPEGKVPLVNVLQIHDTVFNHFVELQGSVKTDKNIIVFPEASGILTNVYVRKGQRVSRGQKLAVIDDNGQAQQLQQMKVQSELAKTTYERQKRLWDQNIGSEIQFLQAKNNYEAQLEAIDAMKSQLANTVVTAPFSGVIDEVITDPGTVVSAGMSQLFRLVNLGDMYVEAEVPERYLNSVVSGKKVEVEFPVLGKTVMGKVRTAGNFINPANRSFVIQVEIPNPKGEIKPNLTARLRINDYTNSKAMLLPLDVISENQNGDQFIMLAKGEDTTNSYAVAHRSIIETGLSQGDQVEVTSGVSSGDYVIREGARTVKNDQKVEIIKN